ncbi:hypothetical protein [uncultured Zhongshania sp.]|uniref:hypothetical protein n=1 Tax=uncultured Zhongshania sp. TaxID=1642288 RepID=UPI0030DAD9EE
MPVIVALLALIAALLASVFLSAWDVVTSDQWHWMILVIVAIFVAASIWRTCLTPIA